ncbi:MULTISPECIES: TerB family tellurite resistance protein [Chromohalobacter]|nr:MULTISPECIES: TerB family tellurite resistance protein [Chromohalobacter]MCI0508454.1 TerB family tellurite resistance protein [Chromohalobacter sp.]MCI0594653.1 TerB family tellurite resistance protein [Chromohalobacter sp.]
MLEPPQLQRRQVTLELAVAALLCEIMRADYEHDPLEKALLRELLTARLHVSAEEVEELMALAEAEVEQAVDHYEFVSLIREQYGYEDRVALVAQMWQLAFADGELDALEEHRVRRLADLLYVSHSDFIRTKLEAMPVR